MLRGAGPERRVSGHLELHPGDLLRHRKESRAGAIVLLVLVVGAVGVRVGEDDELTYIADWFADCLAGRTPDSALTLVGQDGRIRRTPWSDRPPYHHGLPEIVL